MTSREPADTLERWTRAGGTDADACRFARGDRGGALRGGRDRRWDHGGRGRSRCGFAGVFGRAAGARRLRRRHLEPLLEDGPRRAPLPAELRPRAGARGAAGAAVAGAPGAAPRLPDALPGRRARRGQAGPEGRHRAEHVRRDGGHPGRSRSPRAAREILRPGPRGGALVVPGPPPHDRPRRGAGAGPGARLARPPRRLPLLRLPDRRRPPRPHRPRRGRALRRGDAERRRGGRGHRRPRRPRRRRLRRVRLGRTDRGRRRPRRQRHRRLGRRDPPRGGRGGGRAADRAQPRHPPGPRRARPADGQRRLHRPRRRRADDLRAPLVRADADRHHRQRLRRRHPPPAPGRGRSRVPARRGERLLRDEPRGRATWSAPTPGCGR